MTKHILLVEDDPFIRELYGTLLKNAGFTMELAENGEEGVTKYKSQKFDLVLLDIILPGINGIEVLKSIRSMESSKDIPILMITNVEDKSFTEESLKNGANGYYVKAQLNPADLVKEVQKHLK